MRFSIIIPTYNRANLLDQAIQSALSQTYANREIVIIDDGSSDHTAMIASKYGSTVRYVARQNGGKAAALNHGLRVAEGDAIIVLDDDDILPREALARHANALMENPLADFSYGRYLRFTGKTWPSPSDLRDEEFVPTRDPRRLVIRLMEKCFLPNPSWAVRRKAQLQAGVYDERLVRSQDYDMILRLARRNEGALVDEVVLLQRTHSDFRGPASERTMTEHSIGMWLKYDAELFAKIEQVWDLDDFRPFPRLLPFDNDFSPSPSLQKGVILFRRKVYDAAHRALSAYGSELEYRDPSSAERMIAAGLLGCNHGINDLLDRSTFAGDVASRLRTGNWPISVRMAFASQIRWRVRSALLDNVRLAGALVSFSCRAFGAQATIAVLASRYAGGAGSWKGSATRTYSTPMYDRLLGQYSE